MILMLTHISCNFLSLTKKKSLINEIAEIAPLKHNFVFSPFFSTLYSILQCKLIFLNTETKGIGIYTASQWLRHYETSDSVVLLTRVRTTILTTRIITPQGGNQIQEECSDIKDCHQYCCSFFSSIFWQMVGRIREVFFASPRGIIPRNFSSSGSAISQQLMDKQTHSLTSYCFKVRINSKNQIRI